MKHIKTLILIATALLLCNADAFAQKRLYPEFHYLAVPLSFGYSNYLSPNFKNEISTFKNPGLIGGTVGIGYEYRYRKFWMSLGLEGQILTSRLKPGITSMDTVMTDTDGSHTGDKSTCTYHYTFNKWQDDQMGIYGCFPMMFGVRFNAFYVGVGAKVGYCFYATSTPKVQYTTTASYSFYYDDFHDMPNHFLTSYTAGQTNGGSDTKFDFGLNVAAIAEIGYEVYHSDGDEEEGLPWLIKVGAYAEYGFLSAYTNNGVLQSQIGYKTVTKSDGTQGVDPSQMLVAPFYKAHDTRNVSINPLYVGCKVTFMFELPVPQKCHCLQNERGASWRNTAPKQTKHQDKKAKKNVKKQKTKQTNESTGNSNLKPEKQLN